MYLASDEEWQIGLVVGPSGSGKSTVANTSVRQRFIQKHRLADRSSRDRLLRRPLGPSRGRSIHRRRFRLAAILGKALPRPQQRRTLPLRLSKGTIEMPGSPRSRISRGRAQCRGFFELPANPQPQIPLVAFDEFTSVVDRNVAKVCSAAIAKGIRRGHLPCRFVAVTCHYDVAEWLEPDWILDMATGELRRRRLRRPRIELEIHRCKLAAWQLFKRHHYLSGSLAPAPLLPHHVGRPAGEFLRDLPVIMKKNHRRFSRIVTLPDYQGIGIGMRTIAAVAELHRVEGHRINVTSSHPALIRHCQIIRPCGEP